MSDSLANILSFIRVQDARWTAVNMSPNARINSGKKGDIHCLLALEGGSYITSRSGVGSNKINVGEVALLLDDSFELRPTASDDNGGTNEEKLLDSASAFSSVGGKEAETKLLICSFKIETIYRNLMRRLLPPLVITESHTKAVPEWATFMANVDAFKQVVSETGGEAISRRHAEICLIQTVCFFERQPQAMNAQNSTHNRQITKAVRLINNQPTKNWTVESLAREVGMSRSSFSDAFSRSIGEAPVQHLSRIRMKKAAQMLNSDSLTLMEIAHHVGYSSDISLSRAFKRFFGLPPSKYRRDRFENDAVQAPNLRPFPIVSRPVWDITATAKAEVV